MRRRALAASAVMVAAALAPPPASAVERGPVRHHELIGRSVRGRRIQAFERGVPSATPVMIVGCIHGNECAGTAIISKLRRIAEPTDLDLWLIPDLNPDGHARGTRQNARGVDLNRNFSYAWQPIGSRGSTYYSGPSPFSEPESRVAKRFILEHRPRVTIWYHQHMALVARSGGNSRIQRRYARRVNLPLRRLSPLPGTATRWQNHRLRRTTAFVVELPAGPMSHRAVRRHARAVLKILR
jgi:protein MpaA